MREVIGGDTREHSSLLCRVSSDAALRRIFESEETGLFHLALHGDQPVSIGHEQIVSVILCLDGRVVLTEDGEETIVERGSYAVVQEGQMCTLAAGGGGAEALLFFGLEQLPGAFFNSFGPANV
jgi:mannose-6-phosphate isomerase class I